MRSFWYILADFLSKRNQATGEADRALNAIYAQAIAEVKPTVLETLASGRSDLEVVEGSSDEFLLRQLDAETYDLFKRYKKIYIFESDLALSLAEFRKPETIQVGESKADGYTLVFRRKSPEVIELNLNHRVVDTHPSIYHVIASLLS